MGDGSRVATCFPGFFVDLGPCFGGLEGVGGVEKEGAGGMPKEEEDEVFESLAYVRVTWTVRVNGRGLRRCIIRMLCRTTET